MQQPSVGRVVHYVSHGTPVRPDGTQAYTAQCRAATITQVHNQTAVGLCVLNPTGLFFHESCLYHGGDPTDAPGEVTYRGGSWHWPERV